MCNIQATKSPTFNEVVQVAHVKLWQQCRPLQNGDIVDNFQLCQPCQIRLWRQCVPALIQPWLCTKSVLTIKIVKQAVCISVCWCLITTAYISGLIASLLLTAGTVQPGRWTFLLNISPSLANNTWQHASENQVTSSSLVPLYACTVIPGSTTVLLQLEIKTFM